MIIETLTMDLAQRSYPIIVGSEFFLDKHFWAERIAGSQVCVVTNTTLEPLYLEKFKAIFSSYTCSTVVLPDGEAHKNFDNFLQIINQLITDNHHRDTTLIALGGGVIGDLTGFAASCYQRGVNFIQLPTTLLAQVDAAIGGKTGINYREIKNVLGAFYQPKAVVIDTHFLSTLPEREFRASLAEIIKYGLISDRIFFDYLYENSTKILARSPEVLAYIIKVSCQIKIKFVEQDEQDKNKKRALLNFGHTFGHALESATQYAVLHGEAVAWGMRKACQLACDLNYLLPEEVAQVENLLNTFGLLVSVPSTITANELLFFMKKDKKFNQAITLILLKNLGEAFVTNKVEVNAITKILERDDVG